MGYRGVSGISGGELGLQRFELGEFFGRGGPIFGEKPIAQGFAFHPGVRLGMIGHVRESVADPFNTGQHATELIENRRLVLGEGFPESVPERAQRPFAGPDGLREGTGLGRAGGRQTDSPEPSEMSCPGQPPAATDAIVRCYGSSMRRAAARIRLAAPSREIPQSNPVSASVNP
jgi:hypothetical protein